MGFYTKYADMARARPVHLERVREYEAIEGIEQVWNVTWREQADRGNFLTLQILRLLNILGFPSTGWLHYQGVFTSEQKARAYVQKFDNGTGKWDIWPSPINEGFPLERIRPAWLYSPGARFNNRPQVLESNFVVAEKAEYEKLKSQAKGSQLKGRLQDSLLIIQTGEQVLDDVLSQRGEIQAALTDLDARLCELERLHNLQCGSSTNGASISSA